MIFAETLALQRWSTAKRVCVPEFTNCHSFGNYFFQTNNKTAHVCAALLDKINNKFFIFFILIKRPRLILIFIFSTCPRKLCLQKTNQMCCIFFLVTVVAMQFWINVWFLSTFCYKNFTTVRNFANAMNHRQSWQILFWTNTGGANEIS